MVADARIGLTVFLYHWDRELFALAPPATRPLPQATVLNEHCNWSTQRDLVTANRLP